jgi:hypothetical protein
MDNYLDELLTPKNFELHFDEIFHLRNSFIVPIKEIRIEDIHYNPFDQFTGPILISNVNLIELQSKIITGTVINNVYTILNFK